MPHRKSLVSVERRILLHLLQSQPSQNQYDVPTELTPTGIAEVLGTNKTYIFTTIKKSVEKGYVKECFGRIKNKKKKQKYYILTRNGKKYTQRLIRELSNLPITMKLSNDTQKIMKLNEIIPYLEKEDICSDLGELDIYKLISKDATIFIGHSLIDGSRIRKEIT
jgi:DNA-binding MarR family transcriptional regulator